MQLWPSASEIVIMPPGMVNGKEKGMQRLFLIIFISCVLLLEACNLFKTRYEEIPPGFPETISTVGVVDSLWRIRSLEGSERALSHFRGTLVSRKTLAEIAETLKLKKYLHLGTQEQKQLKLFCRTKAIYFRLNNLRIAVIALLLLNLCVKN